MTPRLIRKFPTVVSVLYCAVVPLCKSIICTINRNGGTLGET